MLIFFAFFLVLLSVLSAHRSNNQCFPMGNKEKKKKNDQKSYSKQRTRIKSCGTVNDKLFPIMKRGLELQSTLYGGGWRALAGI